MQVEPNPKATLAQWAELHAVEIYAVAPQPQIPEHGQILVGEVEKEFINLEIIGGAAAPGGESRFITIQPEALDDLITVLQFLQKQLADKDNP